MPRAATTALAAFSLSASPYTTSVSSYTCMEVLPVSVTLKPTWRNMSAASEAAPNVATVVNRNRIAARIDRAQHVGSIGLRRLASTNAIHHFRNRIVGRNLIRFTARLRRIRRQSSNLHILGRNGANALEECSDCLYVHVGLHEVRKSVHAHIAKPTLYRGRLLHKGHCHERLYLATRLFSVHGVIICSACENRLLAAESLLACRKPHIARLGIDDIFGKIDINAAKFVNELSEILRINRCIMGQL